MKYLITATKTRDIQINTGSIPGGDYVYNDCDDCNWIDGFGEVILGTFSATTPDEALQLASEEYQVVVENLAAYLLGDK